MRSIAAFLLVLAAGSTTYPQTIGVQHNPRPVLKISPQHLFDYSLKTGLEQFNSGYSKSIVFFITSRIDGSRNTVTRDGYSGIAAEVQYRKYLRPMEEFGSDKDRKGVYWSAFLQGGYYKGAFRDSYSSLDQNTGKWITGFNYDFKETIRNGAAGLTFGIQKTVLEIVYVDVYVGSGIQLAKLIRKGMIPPYELPRGGIVHPGHQGILAKIGLNLGIRL